MVWQVHMCNKLASRHVRVGLAEPSEVPHCDICENAPGMWILLLPLLLLCLQCCHITKSFLPWHLYVAFFYCEVDGSSLCLQCDMLVHVGGKRTHGRYLLLRQRVEVCGFLKLLDPRITSEILLFHWYAIVVSREQTWSLGRAGIAAYESRRSKEGSSSAI